MIDCVLHSYVDHRSSGRVFSLFQHMHVTYGVRPTSLSYHAILHTAVIDDRRDAFPLVLAALQADDSLMIDLSLFSLIITISLRNRDLDDLMDLLRTVATKIVSVAVGHDFHPSGTHPLWDEAFRGMIELILMEMKNHGINDEERLELRAFSGDPSLYQQWSDQLIDKDRQEMALAQTAVGDLSQVFQSEPSSPSSLSWPTRILSWFGNRLKTPSSISSSATPLKSPSHFAIEGSSSVSSSSSIVVPSDGHGLTNNATAHLLVPPCRFSSPELSNLNTWDLDVAVNAASRQHWSARKRNPRSYY